MLISHEKWSQQKHLLKFILTFDKWQFWGRMSNGAKNTFDVANVLLFISHKYTFLPIISHLHNSTCLWNQNDNYLSIGHFLCPRVDKQLWENLWLLIAKMCWKQKSFTLHTVFNISKNGLFNIFLSEKFFSSKEPH